ncbi:3-oxoacyl-[acyl-carrier protein] reductase, partial [Paenibacillus phyllosphaerae]
NLGADIFFTHWSPFDALEGNGLDQGWPEKLRLELLNLGVRAKHMEANLSKIETPNSIMDQVERELGRATILINNATYERSTNYRDLDSAILDKHYSVNVRGTVLLTTEFAKRFADNLSDDETGRVIFMVSGGPDPNNLAYISTKSALVGLVEPLSVALAPLKITVNGFNPGPTDSGWMNDEMRQYFINMFPMGRIGLPEDAAKGIGLLSSDSAQWITGQIIRSEGGYLGK